MQTFSSTPEGDQPRSESYFFTDIRSIPDFDSRNTYRPAPDLGIKRLLVHAGLFLITCVTTTILGTIFPFLIQGMDLASILIALLHNPKTIINGMLFSFTLLTILTTHEFGHYIACRYYGIRSTLPYFIPIPFGIGTLGAFIRIKSPIHSRRALFDVGIAGPLAGFVFALPAAIVSIYYGRPFSISPTETPLSFNHPLLFTLIAKLMNKPPDLEWNPVWFACWVGMVATALNLLPVGQLDGGHVVYALFGKKTHRVVGAFTTLLQAAVAYFAYMFYQWGGGFVYAAMLVFMFILRHPPVTDEGAPLGIGRKILGVIALIVFILSFMPVPFHIN